MSLAPREMPLAREAKRLWVAFHDHVEAATGRWRCRSKGCAALATKPPSMRRAWPACSRWLRTSRRTRSTRHTCGQGLPWRIFISPKRCACLTAGGFDPDVVLAEKLLAWSTGKSRIALAQVYQYGPRPLRDAKTARRIVTLLEEHGWLARVVGGATLDGDFRRDVWRVVS